jgi:hypothetical protein
MEPPSWWWRPHCLPRSTVVRPDLQRGERGVMDMKRGRERKMGKRHT